MALAPTSAAAGCDPRAFFDENVTLDDDISKLAYFDAIDQARYQRLRETGSLGVTVPIYGVPVEFSGDYSKAKQTAEQLKRLLNINYSTEHHRAIYSHILSPAGLDAYKACIAGGGVGVSLWRSRDALTAAKFFIGVKWDGGVGGGLGRFDYVGRTPFQIQGGHVIGEYATHPPRDIRNEQEIIVEIERTLIDPFRFAVTVNGNSDVLELPSYNPRRLTFSVRESPEIMVYSHFGSDGNEGARMVRTMEFIAGPNEEFIPETAHPIAQFGAPTSLFTIDSAEPLRIKYTALADANTRSAGGFVRGHVSVIAASWTP